MSAEIKKATHIHVSAEVRYWEDSCVDGFPDENGVHIPLRDGDLWNVAIRLKDGAIEGWPCGVTANIHYKVCDQGRYWLATSGEHGEGRIAEWRDGYVPDAFLCHGYRGYGDYIIFNVDYDGEIIGWRQPEIDAAEWEKVSP